MYGVPSDLPLHHFLGKEVNPIGIGRFHIRFSIGAGGIGGQGTWELRDPSGQIIDSSQDHAGRDCYRIHRIIDIPITSFSIDPPRSFTLIFESGHSLVIIYDDPYYEAFLIDFEGMTSFII